MFNLWDEQKLFVIQRDGYRQGAVIQIIAEKVNKQSDFPIFDPYTLRTEWEEFKFSTREDLIKHLRESYELSNKKFYKLIGRDDSAVVAVNSKISSDEVPFLIPKEFRKGLLQIEETKNPYPYE